jgi:hypothetical protein
VLCWFGLYVCVLILSLSLQALTLSKEVGGGALGFVKNNKIKLAIDIKQFLHPWNNKHPILLNLRVLNELAN